MNLGPAKAKDLYDDGIKDLDELRQHATKLNHHQQIGLKHFEDFELRIPRTEISEILAELEKCLSELDKECMLAVFILFSPFYSVFSSQKHFFKNK